MDPSRLQTLLREYVRLERRRTEEGLTPLQYQRWQELTTVLTQRFSRPPPGGERRGSVRVPTRIRVEFESEDRVRQAVIRNISRGGLFINTAFALEIGTGFELRIRVRSSGRTLQIPVTVVSQNVGKGFETDTLGMGVAFGNLTPEQREQLDELLAARPPEEDEGPASPSDA